MSQDSINIDVFPTVETVDIVVNPNLTEINITTVTGGGGGALTLQELFEQNASENNNNAVIDISNTLSNVVFSRDNEQTVITSSTIGFFEGNNITSINTINFTITDETFVTVFDNDGILRYDGLNEQKQLRFGTGIGIVTIPDTANEGEIIATREWVTDNAPSGAVDSVNGKTGVVVLDANDVGAEPTLGFTPENVSNKATNLTSPDNTKYPSTQAVADYIVPTASTGNEISFEKLRIYASVATPLTGNLTNDLTGAKLGLVQKLYHNHSVAPTVPGGWVLIGGEYTISELNIIYAEFAGSSRVEYWITQEV